MTSQRRSPIIFEGLRAGLRTFRWVVLLLFVLFWLSGIKEVAPDKVGLLLRFGKLQGTTPATRVREPGLVLALPYPNDQVIQVPAKQEGEVAIEEVWKEIIEDRAARDTIEPTAEGYCLTGDQNVVQARVVVKYRISDPIAFRLHTADPPSVLQDIVLASLTQTICKWDVDDVLCLQREDPLHPGTKEGLAASVSARAQSRLDELECGLRISALEFKEIHPPRHVIAEFRAVQSAAIDRETKKREAEGFASREIPQAEAERNRLMQEASAHESALKARAQVEFSVFEQLVGEYRKNRYLVASRIYLETIEHMLANVGKLDFVSAEDRVILSDVEGKP